MNTNTLRFPLRLIGTNLDTGETFNHPFGRNVSGWEKKWDKAVPRYPDHFITLWRPFDDMEQGRVNYLPLISDCQRYRDAAKEIDWESLIETAKDNQYPEDGRMVGTAFIGTVFDMLPSGKYYMPWAASNVTEDEAGRDTIFMEHLEREASNHGGSITSSEGDPCDIMFEMTFEIKDTDDDADTSAADE
jgi:hypothetical protein